MRRLTSVVGIPVLARQPRAEVGEDVNYVRARSDRLHSSRKESVVCSRTRR